MWREVPNVAHVEERRRVVPNGDARRRRVVPNGDARFDEVLNVTHSGEVPNVSHVLHQQRQR